MIRPVAVLMAAAALGVLVVVVCAGVGMAAGATTWDVYPGEGTPIQDAINDAEVGDTIYVHAGTYIENLDVDKERLTLIGDGADVVTVRAVDAADPVFEVTADWASISGFTVTGAYTSGIQLGGADHCSISDNDASGNHDGIYLDYGSSNNTLTSNTASGNYYSGIFLDDSGNNTLTSNTASGNNYRGIGLYDSGNNTLTSNNASGNYLYGISLYGSRNNTLTSNTASGNNYRGIYLYYSSDNTLTSNDASGSGYDGISLYGSRNNTLTSNNASGNNYRGIYLYYSSGNTVYHNNLVSADYNAYDSDGTNQWDSGSVGNYYSDYTGTDNNTDGIGDIPHLIPGDGSTDRFPLMQPWAGDTPKKGDLNGDDQITFADATIALAIAVGGSASCDPATFAAGDMSGDHSVTSLDALMILQLAAGAIAL